MHRLSLFGVSSSSPSAIHLYSDFLGVYLSLVHVVDFFIVQHVNTTILPELGQVFSFALKGKGHVKLDFFGCSRSSGHFVRCIRVWGP